MRKILLEKTLFKFDELSKDVQQNLIDKEIEYVENYEYYDFVEEDFIIMMSIIGFDIDECRFSGFYSQGDGASFIGKYSYKKYDIKKFKEEYPNEDEIIQLLNELNNFQKMLNYQINVDLEKNYITRYVHEYSVDIIVYNKETEDCFDCDISRIVEIFREFMKIFYNKVNDSYEYVTSNEIILKKFQEIEYFQNGNVFDPLCENVVAE